MVTLRKTSYASTRKTAYFSFPLTAASQSSKNKQNEFKIQSEIVRDACNILGITFHDPTQQINSIKTLPPSKIYERDLHDLANSDIFIIHCGFPSVGTGFEFQHAIHLGVPVIMLIPKTTTISPFLLGAPGLMYNVTFSTPSDLRKDLIGTLKLALGVTELQEESQTPALRSLVHTVKNVNAELLARLRLHPEDVYRLSPRQFEELIAELLQSFGCDVQLTPATKDGGYDLFAISKDVMPGIQTAWIVECKNYHPEHRVGVEIVRALYGTKSDLPGVQAMLATTSFFTSGAKKFKASRYDLHLRDYNGIVEWLNSFPQGRNGTLLL